MSCTGRDDGLFRAAIGESGFGGVLSRFPGGANNTEAMDALYNLFVSNTSCASTANTSASLDCLRSLPFEEINTALNGTEAAPWPPMLDGDFSKYSQAKAFPIPPGNDRDWAVGLCGVRDQHSLAPCPALLATKSRFDVYL